MTKITTHACRDWCHVCGLRLQGVALVDVFYPENAEHADGREKYVRICERCVLVFVAVLSTGTDKFDRDLLRKANKMTVAPMPRPTP